ncbi:MBL fold metallo-hydrolase [Candidatus Fermentibacteria bacterium]|nr:MAG: MBL fold metallo-hydrolase [Candidatus Fermentibacteria bacterium]
MSKLEVAVHVVGPIQTNCYSVRCSDTGKVLLIDPGGDPEILLRDVPEVHCIVYTHGHFDHVGGAASIIAEHSPETMLHPADREMFNMADAVAAEWGFRAEKPPAPSAELYEGLEVRAGHMSFTVMHTPGHSPGSICLYGHGILIAGDTLFAGSIGRTDLPGSSSSAMRKTLVRLSEEIPEDTVIYSGHGPSTVMSQELRTNPFLRACNKT